MVRRPPNFLWGSAKFFIVQQEDPMYPARGFQDGGALGLDVLPPHPPSPKGYRCVRVTRIHCRQIRLRQGL